MFVGELSISWWLEMADGSRGRSGAAPSPSPVKPDSLLLSSASIDAVLSDKYFLRSES